MGGKGIATLRRFDLLGRSIFDPIEDSRQARYPRSCTGVGKLDLARYGLGEHWAALEPVHECRSQ
jgi:hypothetical protein